MDTKLRTAAAARLARSQERCVCVCTHNQLLMLIAHTKQHITPHTAQLQNTLPSALVTLQLQRGRTAYQLYQLFNQTQQATHQSLDVFALLITEEALCQKRTRLPRQLLYLPAPLLLLRRVAAVRDNTGSDTAHRVL